MSETRARAVRSLLEMSSPLDKIAERLYEFEWDDDETQVELSPDHVVNVLRRYVCGELTGSTVEEWANLIEGREDVFFNKATSEWLGNAIHELANPTLTIPLDQGRARELITSGLASAGGGSR